jgi:hypothetical protein
MSEIVYEISFNDFNLCEKQKGMTACVIPTENYCYEEKELACTQMAHLIRSMVVYYMKIADRKRASGQIFQRLFPSFSSCINDINSRSIILFYSTSIYQKKGPLFILF